MNQNDGNRGQGGQQEQQSGSQGQQNGQMNQQSGNRSGQQEQQSGGQGLGSQQNGQQEAQSGGQGYGGQQTGQSGLNDSSGSDRTNGDFGEESLRADQASQEEWDRDSQDTEMGSQNRGQRSQSDFGSNGE